MQVYQVKLDLLCMPVWICILASAVSAQTLNDPNLRVTELVGGLSQPTAHGSSLDPMICWCCKKAMGGFGG